MKELVAYTRFDVEKALEDAALSGLPLPCAISMTASWKPNTKKPNRATTFTVVGEQVKQER